MNLIWQHGGLIKPMAQATILEITPATTPAVTARATTQVATTPAAMELVAMAAAQAAITQPSSRMS